LETPDILMAEALNLMIDSGVASQY